MPVALLVPNYWERDVQKQMGVDKGELKVEAPVPHCGRLLDRPLRAATRFAPTNRSNLLSCSTPARPWPRGTRVRPLYLGAGTILLQAGRPEHG